MKKKKKVYFQGFYNELLKKNKSITFKGKNGSVKNYKFIVKILLLISVGSRYLTILGRLGKVGF